MEYVFIGIIVYLSILALSGLSVGVGNHAVNIVNSALGPRAASVRPVVVVGAMGVLLSAVTGSEAYAQTADKSPLSLSLPEINGTIRAKYEYEPDINMGRFEVRNARLSVSGSIIPTLSYKAEIDLSDEGKIKMLDAYARFTPSHWSLTMGQMRVPFTIDAHRSPHKQYFANRSFIAKQVGNVRDVGLAGAYTFSCGVPVTLEGGIFNGSGLTNQKDYWTKSYNFSFKAMIPLLDGRWVISPSCQRTRPGDVGIMMWDVGTYYHANGWHIEGEYLRKNYSHGAFKGVNAFDIFCARRFPLRKMLNGVSALARYDYMSDHSDGIAGDDGQLKVNDPERHRVTIGSTLHFGTKKLYAEFRLNYEKYFYNHNADIPISGHDKIVAEIMVHF